MSEGSRRLRMQIASILGVAAIAISSVDEQIPSCIRAIPTRRVAIASCPGQLTGISHGVSLAYVELTSATPILASAAGCSDNPEIPLHLEQKNDAPDEMPFLLRNSSANFFAHQIDPRRRQFIQPDQYNKLAIHIPQSCPVKDQAPLHLERKDEIALPVNRILTAETGSLVMNGQVADLLMGPPDDGDDMELAYNSAPCPDKDRAPLHLEPDDRFEPKGKSEITGSGNLVADANIIEGSDSLLPSFVTSRPEIVENPAPAFIPAQRT